MTVQKTKKNLPKIPVRKYYSLKKNKLHIVLKGLLIGLCVLFLPSFNTPAIDTNAKLKAMFIYNFTRYVDWPQSYKEGNFVIGILGKSTLNTELTNFVSQGKKAGGTQPFEIKNFTSNAGITKCHILIVSSEFAGDLGDVFNKVKSSSTLVVTEKRGMAEQGAAINFVVHKNKQEFELNKANAEKHDLKVSSTLEKFAAKVY